uniref:Uncharacterized protein n=1 Tax=Molossus molossus TaxID=27622 RepID=A0A7J8DT91_MOLMO|nr:hypothetical protein HJG59_009148 [Molossus molossus]
MRLQLTVEDGARDWFPACRWGCGGPASLNCYGSDNAPTVMSSPRETLVPAENSQRQTESPGILPHIVLSVQNWSGLYLTLNKHASSWPLHLCCGKRYQGLREQHCVKTGSTACWPSHLTARGWE